MNSLVIENVFSKEEVAQLKQAISEQLSKREHVEWIDEVHGQYTYVDTIVKIQEQLGRSTCSGIQIPINIIEKIYAIVNDKESNNEYVLMNDTVTYGEYNPKFGTPDLAPHYDGGKASLILDYQLESTVDWAIGVDDELHLIKDNSALFLKPLEYSHYRPKRIWNDGEYVKMLYFDLRLDTKESHRKKINNIYNGIQNRNGEHHVE
jgi:hypothetical protein